MGRLSDEDVKKADNANIMEVARKLNLPLIFKNERACHVKGYGGLYINPLENKWNCFSKAKGGGVIQFYMFITGKSWRQSVVELLDNSLVQAVSFARNKNIVSKSEKKEEFILPPKSKSYAKMYAYLMKSRKISKSVIDYFVANNQLYQSEKHNNIVFVGMDVSGIARYAALRGTNTYCKFRGEVENSNKAFSFSRIGSSDKLIVFESPIDLMSYMSLQEGADHLLSLGGISDVALIQYLKDYKNIKVISLALDNDTDGIKATTRITEEYSKAGYEITHQVFQGKDYNDYLTMVNSSEQTKEIEEAYEI